MRTPLRLLAFVASLLLAAPAWAGVLIVQAKSDFQPGVDFDRIWIDLTRVETGVTRRFFHVADPTVDYSRRVRLFEVETDTFSVRPFDTADGHYLFTLRVFDAGVEVYSRHVSTHIHGARVVELPIYRNIEPLQPVLIRSLAVDQNGDGAVGPGDVLRTRVSVAASHAAGPGTLYHEFFGPGLRLVPGSVETSHGGVDLGNEQDDEDVRVELGLLDEGTQASIEYDVVVDPVVVGQGYLTVDGPQFYDAWTDDPFTQGPPDPTTTPVTCGEDQGGACCGDLGECQGDVQTCRAERDGLAEKVGGLEARLAALLDDADADGVIAARDDCTETAPRHAVDPRGCSLAQFCARHDVAERPGRRSCRQADWLEDEVGAPRDCRPRRHVCEPF